MATDVGCTDGKNKIFIRKRLRTERVGNQTSERERLSSAESSLRKEIFEVPPGAD